MKKLVIYRTNSRRSAAREHHDGYRKVDLMPLDNSGIGSNLKEDHPACYGNDVSYDHDDCREVRHYSTENRKNVDKYHKERDPAVDVCVDNVESVDTENSPSGYQNTDQSVEAMSTLRDCAR